MTRTQVDDVTVRAASTDDAPGLDAMLRLLTPTSAFMRFMAGFGEPKPALVRGLLATGPRRGALLAVLPGGTAVGHACWSVDDAGAVDVGVAVLDGWQRQGLGRRLVRACLGRAREVGAVALHLDIHPANRGLLTALRRQLPSAQPRVVDGLVALDVPLADLALEVLPADRVCGPGPGEITTTGGAAPVMSTR